MAFIISEILLVFYKTRKNEKHKGDDIRTPDIIENKYGDYCDECGATIDDKHKFCTNCGKNVR